MLLVHVCNFKSVYFPLVGKCIFLWHGKQKKVKYIFLNTYMNLPLFFLCICKCYILSVTVVYCTYNVRQLALQLPCLFINTSMFKFVSYPAWRFLVWHFSILRWFSDPSTLHQTGGAKLYIGRVRPEIHPLTLLYAFLDRKGTPLVYLLLTNGTSHKLV